MDDEARDTIERFHEAVDVLRVRAGRVAETLAYVKG
jgi:hypothetical protein